MGIPNFSKIDNDFLYSDFVKYNYKFGDLDLMSGGGLLGNSVMNFGLFYYETADLLKMQEEARFLLNIKNSFPQIIYGDTPSTSTTSSTGSPEFDPLTYDVNTVALWDGNDAGVAQWDDQVGSYPLVYGRNDGSVSLPDVIVKGINGHNYVQFYQNGVYICYAKGSLPVQSQPSTQYLVVGVNTWIGNRYIMDDGVVTLRNAMRQQNTTPNVNYTSVSSNGSLNLPLTEFHIITIVKQAGALLSEIRVDDNPSSVYTQGTLSDDAGYTLNANTNLTIFTSITSKWAYIIRRNGVDNTATQNLFINWLKTRFGI